MLIALATLLHAPPPTARAIVVALSPMEQYQQQQQKLREQRMQRVEAEEAAARGETAAALPAEDEGFRARFAAQLHAFDTELFPPEQYSQRNQESRKDGYWAFVGKGEEPPLDFTYGEFPLPLFSQLVDRACELRGILTLEARRDAVLIDLGSGAGRLALWAAATSVWRRVVGVEYLPTLAASASAKLAEARDASRFPGLLQTSDVHLVEGSWDDPLDLFGDVDVAFAYTTAITANEDGVLEALSAALTKRLRRGCLVVTTDYTLDPSFFEVIESIEGANAGVGGVSTGYIHRKTSAGERDDDFVDGGVAGTQPPPAAAPAPPPTPAPAPAPTPPPPAPTPPPPAVAPAAASPAPAASTAAAIRTTTLAADALAKVAPTLPSGAAGNYGGWEDPTEDSEAAARRQWLADMAAKTGDAAPVAAQVAAAPRAANYGGWEDPSQDSEAAARRQWLAEKGAKTGGVAAPAAAQVAAGPAANYGGWEDPSQDSEAAARRRWLAERAGQSGVYGAKPGGAAAVSSPAHAATSDALSTDALMHLCLNGSPEDAGNAEAELDRRRRDDTAGEDIALPALGISQDGMDKLAAAGVPTTGGGATAGGGGTAAFDAAEASLLADLHANFEEEEAAMQADLLAAFGDSLS